MTDSELLAMEEHEMEMQFAEEDRQAAEALLAEQRYCSIRAKLEALESSTGMYLFEHNVVVQNVTDGGCTDSRSAYYWELMRDHAVSMAATMAEEAGQNINTLSGENLY